MPEALGVHALKLFCLPLHPPFVLLLRSVPPPHRPLTPAPAPSHAFARDLHVATPSFPLLLLACVLCPLLTIPPTVALAPCHAFVCPCPPSPCSEAMAEAYGVKRAQKNALLDKLNAELDEFA